MLPYLLVLPFCPIRLEFCLGLEDAFILLEPRGGAHLQRKKCLNISNAIFHVYSYLCLVEHLKRDKWIYFLDKYQTTNVVLRVKLINVKGNGSYANQAFRVNL